MKHTLLDARPAPERRRVGSYELVARIGSGGMGEVWRATHVHLPRSAAVKLIQPQLISQRPGHSSDVLVQRFKREAAATAALRSPHTIQLYDFGITDDGVFFYAMELLEGCSLRQLTDTTGPVPAERAVDLLAQVCESLAEAHDAGVIHRDIKPANIFLCKLGVTYDFVKVLDFGLVKFTAGSPLESAQLTGVDASHGTPAFMPPEVVDGSTHFDARSDVYAVGCVAFWLLTGRLVFEVESPIGLVMAHVHEPAPAPSSVTELPVPPALDELVLRCLSKDPDARPQTAKELLDALRACPLERPWDQDRAKSWWDTHRPTEWVDHSAVEGTFEEASVGPAVPDGPRWWPFAVGAVGLVVAMLAAALALRPGSDGAPANIDEPLGTVDEEPGTVDEPLGIIEPPIHAAVEAVARATEPCRLWAEGPPVLWSDVRDGTGDEMSWLSGDDETVNADVVLRYSAEKAASGSETWRSCRRVTLISGGETIEACSECVTREYTFATLSSVERWHAGFATSLGEQCTRQTLEALEEHCAALRGVR